MDNKYLIVPFRRNSKGRVQFAVNQIVSDTISKHVRDHAFIMSGNDNLALLKPRLENMGLSVVGFPKTMRLASPEKSINYTVVVVHCKYKSLSGTELAWVTADTILTKLSGFRLDFLSAVIKVALSTAKGT